MPRHPYRFRGSIQPSAEIKRPVRAELTGEVDGAGAKLYLYDVIDSWGGDWGVSAKEFGAALAELSGVSQITLHINSPGGEVYEGVAILNALRRHPASVTAVVDGIAASAASFIAVGADRVVMGRNAEMMIHDAWGIAMGPAADMHAMGDQLDKISNNIAGIYSAKNGNTVEAMRQLMLAETWLSDQEAVDLGLADEIEGAPLDPAVIENAFDLSVFKNAGRTNAPAPQLAADEIRAKPGEVACWHTGPDTPCDYDVCRQPGTLADDEARERRRRQNRNRLNLAQKRVTAVTR